MVKGLVHGKEGQYWVFTGNKGKDAISTRGWSELTSIIEKEIAVLYDKPSGQHIVMLGGPRKLRVFRSDKGTRYLLYHTHPRLFRRRWKGIEFSGFAAGTDTDKLLLKVRFPHQKRSAVIGLYPYHSVARFAGGYVGKFAHRAPQK